MNKNTLSEKIDLLSLDENELKMLSTEMGEPSYKGTQIFSWLHKGAAIEEMSNLSIAFRQKLAEKTYVHLPEVEKKLVSKIDGTVKYLFKLHDGECVESVLMHYKYGYTLCLSTQAGCRMGCKFCASTIAGFSRHLLPSEILGQILAAQKESQVHISHLVLMGIGEPLDNYVHVIKFLKLVSAPGGLNISCRNISLSTCGLADKIVQLANEKLPVTLSVSLHCPNDQKRSELMPINKKFSIDELLKACQYYFSATKRRISFEYALIANKNDAKTDADELSRLLLNYLNTNAFHVNLIPINEVSERNFKRSSKQHAENFVNNLAVYGINATIRRKLGSDINASCGQLRSQHPKTNTNL